jgi:asparagine synthase (glutamine-hydrolysing)
MCGLTGWFRSADSERSIDMLRVVRGMSTCLVHRGPDSAGEWADDERGIALGFRRLSIIDTSVTGDQPMFSASGRYVIAFNGEVYNFQRIHAELGSPELRGHSDTAVMLAAIERWGVREAVTRFIGMFAFALWDRDERTLTLVRDRLGVKPLYIGSTRDGIVFASELKAFSAHPTFEGTIDRGALALYARYNYIPAPLTIFDQVRKLMPGSMLVVRDPKHLPEAEAYWSARDEAMRGAADPFRGSDREAIDELRALLDDSIALRQIADVPVGVFLSSGVDSPTVASIMAAQATSPVRTFTIGTEDPNGDESAAAAAIAAHLNTTHVSRRVTADDALNMIPLLPRVYDEPFADSSAIPTLLVSRLAREHVTVALSGDGGDELFGGYERYAPPRSAWSATARLPRIARRTMGGVLRSASQSRVYREMERSFGPLRAVRLGSRGAKFANALLSEDPDALYIETLAQWRNLVRDVAEVADPFRPELRAPLATHAERAMLLDLITYLPDDLLVKVDRASMSVSLEAREPLLDHRIVEFAMRLPLHMKLRDGQGKWILRRVLEQHVPARLMPTRKLGFSVPVGAWLRGPLRSWADELLDPQAMRDDGFFDADLVEAHWREHVTDARGWDNHLWTVLMFQAWLREWRAEGERRRALVAP